MVSPAKERAPKKSMKERFLAAVYNGQKPASVGKTGNARQTLKANLRQNMKL